MIAQAPTINNTTDDRAPESGVLAAPGWSDELSRFDSSRESPVHRSGVSLERCPNLSLPTTGSELPILAGQTLPTSATGRLDNLRRRRQLR